MSNILTDAEIFDIVQPHLPSKGHAYIWATDPKYAKEVGIDVGTRWIINEMQPEQTLEACRAIEAATAAKYAERIQALGLELLSAQAQAQENHERAERLEAELAAAKVDAEQRLQAAEERSTFLTNMHREAYMMARLYGDEWTKAKERIAELEHKQAFAEWEITQLVFASPIYRAAVSALNGVKAWRDCDGNDGFPHEVREQIDAILLAYEARLNGNAMRTGEQPCQHQDK